MYIGQWRGDNKDGKGKMLSPARDGFVGVGDEFEGEWKKDVKHGRGLIKYADGETYDGEYRNDKKHGHGTMTYPSGDSYEGAYRHGKRDGSGTYKRASGLAIVCTFVEDEPVVHFAAHSVVK